MEGSQFPAKRNHTCIYKSIEIMMSDFQQYKIEIYDVL